MLAAALVNRAWYAAAVPILWRQPTELALHTEAVPSSARRAWYASYIRKARVSWPSPLWSALVEAVEIGGDRPDAGGGACGAGPGRRRLRLTALHVERCQWASHEPKFFHRETHAIRDQVPLLQFINADLEELSCYLTSDVMERLEAMSAVPTPHGEAGEAWDAGLLQRRQQRHVALRKLQLYGREFGNIEADDAVQERLLQWLTHEPFLAPSLTAVQLSPLFHSSSMWLMDQAFKHFAMRDGLEELRLGSCIFSNQGLLPTAIKDVASSARAFSRACNHCYDSNELDPPRKRQRRRQPFEHLKTLDIAIDSQAVLLSLVSVIWSVRRLTLAIRGRSFTDYASTIFLPFVFLRQLRALHLDLGGAACIFRGDIRPLHDLTELRELSLLDATAGDITDEDVAKLLRALPRLHALAFSFHVPQTTSQLLQVIGESRPQLRRLTLSSSWSPGPSMDNAPVRPLFPCLEYLLLKGYEEQDIPETK